jgi:hypothetical protein
MSDPTLEAEPTLLRKIVSGIIVVALVISVWWFIEWRTAPPPPPNIPMPEPEPELVEDPSAAAPGPAAVPPAPADAAGST